MNQPVDINSVFAQKLANPTLAAMDPQALVQRFAINHDRSTTEERDPLDVTTCRFFDDFAMDPKIPLAQLQQRVEQAILEWGEETVEAIFASDTHHRSNSTVPTISACTTRKWQDGRPTSLPS